MGLHAYLEAGPFREISKIDAVPPPGSVSFSGLPRKHPYDPEKMILIRDPLGDEPECIEFRIRDIVKAEEEAAPVTLDGESLVSVRLWLAKGTRAIRYEPFEVDTPPRSMRDSESLKESFLRSLFGQP